MSLVPAAGLAANIHIHLFLDENRDGSTLKKFGWLWALSA